VFHITKPASLPTAGFPLLLQNFEVGHIPIWALCFSFKRGLHPRNLGVRVKTKHYQVWLRGSDLCDVRASNKAEARKQVKEFYGYKRLPRGTCVIEIPSNYYERMVENKGKSRKSQSRNFRMEPPE
jgi:hypothetical protein